jgi:flagellar hook-associated protein 1 FlgK
MANSSLMSIGLTAMTASYAQLQVTGNNIANQGVEGYSQQSAALATAPGQFTGAGFFGHGVSVVNVTRAHDQFLTAQAAMAASMAAMDDARSTQLNQLQLSFPADSTGLGTTVGTFLNSFVALGNNPSDSSTRQVVLADATATANQFANMSTQLDTLQSGVNAALTTSVGTVNHLAVQVAALNDQIASYNGLDQKPNSLLDQRDALVKQISGLIQVSPIPASDGTVALMVTGGQPLVLGSFAQQLVVSPDNADASHSQIGMTSSGAVVPLDTRQLAGGSIAGLLKFQDNDLESARNQLGQMATAFASRVNQVQSLGLDLGNPPSSGPPIFSTGAPQTLANSSNARNADGTFVAQPSITIADATQLQASNYSLIADPSGTPGQYQLTRQSDGLVRTVSDGDTVDGFTLHIGTPAPAQGDRFLIKPVANAANGMACVLNDPNGIAAASPVTATVGVANTGTATVSQLTVVSPSVDPSLTANISFTSGAGAYSWNLTDSSGTVTSSGTGTWTPGQPISLNGFQVSLNGVPNAGDTVQVAATLFPATNNGNAVNLSNLQNETMVGRTLMPDGTTSGGATITDAYASTMAGIGVRVQSANTAASISAAASTQADNANSSVSGVNLDEEAARLIQYQQAYQAASKVLQVAQTIMDTLLQLAGS